MLSWSEFVRRPDNPRPVLDLSPAHGALLYIGAHHSHDANDPQVPFIEEEWKRFVPTIALNEGGNWPAALDAREAVLQSGEPGLVRFLADSSGVPLLSLEPDLRDEIADHLKTFSVPQVKLFYVLRLVAQQRDLGRPLGDTDVERLLDHYGSLGLAGVPNTVQELDRMTHDMLGMPWREVKRDMFDPVFQDNGEWRAARDSDVFTHRIAASTFRDRYMAGRIAELVERGDRVFAVAGKAHITLQEGYLRCRLVATCPQ